MNKFLFWNFLTALIMFIFGFVVGEVSVISGGIVCFIVVSCTQIIYEKIEGKKRAIFIVLDESDHQNPIFVEIEDSKGKSIRVGTRIKMGDEFTRLRITEKDLRS